MKWVALVHYLDSTGDEKISVTEIVGNTGDKRNSTINSSQFFSGNTTIRTVRDSLKQALYRIFKSPNEPVSICVCWLDLRLKDPNWYRFWALQGLLPSKTEKKTQIQNRSFDGSSLCLYKWEDSPAVIDLVKKIGIEAWDIKNQDLRKFQLLWEWFAHLHQQRMRIKNLNDTKFIWVCTPPDSILFQVLTERWEITDSFWTAFCKTGYWNVCVKPIWWKQNPPFSDVIATIIADEDDKNTWAPPTIVWADKPTPSSPLSSAE